MRTIKAYDIPACIFVKAAGRNATEIAAEIGISREAVVNAFRNEPPAPELLAWLGLREVEEDGVKFYEEIK